MRWILIAAAAAVLPLDAQTVLKLAPAPAVSAGGARFEFDAAGERRARWSTGGLRRHYFHENLPALFSRTLVLDAPLQAGAALDWIFTGDEGGLTVKLEPGRVRLIQRYYNSYGHFADRPPKTRYPDRVWQESAVELQGTPLTLELVLDHKLSAALLVNGQPAARQTCLMEMRRHQLAWTTPAGVTTGKLTGRVAAPPAREAKVRVKPEEKHQTVLGFGGIMSVPAWASLSEEGQRRWWELVREYNLLIQREYPNGYRLKADLSNFDRLTDASPHYYGDNFPNGEISDFGYNRRMREMGGKIIFQFWDLPPWARGEKDLPKIEEYVRAMVGYCRIAKEKAGAPPDVVGVQNEIVQPAEVWHQMILRLREGLDAAGFRNVRIHMPDNSNLRGGIRTAQAIRKSAEAWKAIDWAATHVYDFQQFYQEPDGYDAVIKEWMEAVGTKPFLSTEFTVNHNAYQSRSYRVAFAHAQLYHKNLALMNASALIYCWSLLDIEQESFGSTRSLFVADRSRGFVPAPSGPQLRVFGAFSRYLPEGMVRVGADSGDAHLLVTAWAGAKGGKTAILTNRATAPVRVTVDWAGARFNRMEVAGPYDENAAKAGAGATITIQPGEIVTLAER